MPIFSVKPKATPLALGLVLVLTLSADAQNLILNGDFEAEPHDPVATILNWDIGGPGFVHSAMEGATSGDFSAALSIGGDTEGNILSQTFPTTIGQTYVVEFDSGVYGTRTDSHLQLNVAVSGNGTLLDRTITPPDAFTNVANFVVFHHYRYAFTADSTTSTLAFTDIGLGNADADIVIDTVSVMPATLPSPTTLPLTNADFETGPYNVNGTVAGWLVTGNTRASILPQGSTSGTHSVAFSSGGDFQDVMLSQNFFTTAGRHYAVDFDAAVYGVTTLTQTLRLSVTGGASLIEQLITPPYFGTFDISAIQLQHYHFVFVADSSVSTIELTQFGFDNTNADIVLDTVSIAPVSPTFAEWQAEHFDAAQLNNPQVSGWDADPDHDQIANGFEYFYNTDPLAGVTVQDSILLPRTAIETFNSNRYLTYTYHRRIGWFGNSEVIGVSDQPIGWDTSGGQVVPVSVTPSGDGITELVKIRLTTPVDQIPLPRNEFLRLSLTQ
ncbi:MAG TPA: DUF642 domain-containing protein [Chthoniobacterales bacterium]|nr:DUF642 domain-containing protein [Chthoniobacterales bacterium]